ncbi:hypothetical protein C4D60_Mb06t11610 [Musa balbisiana]|uniref:Uncharacterized protein n=1 Tax=Musa balbisiana TaxID=52838 RepID=A0A4S8IMC8_MUSBA|nr:hypothetical protein C4D60_Mb06t11610 [Musa balbisiana]
MTRIGFFRALRPQEEERESWKLSSFVASAGEDDELLEEPMNLERSVSCGVQLREFLRVSLVLCILGC